MIFRQQSHHNRLDVCPSLAEQVRLLRDFAESFFIVQHWQHVLLLVLGGTGEQDSSSMHELTQAYVISSSQAALNRYESDRIGMNTVAREHHRKYDLTLTHTGEAGWLRGTAPAPVSSSGDPRTISTYEIGCLDPVA